MATQALGAAETHQYHPSSPLAWILAHLSRHRLPLVGFAAGAILWNVLTATIPTMLGAALDSITRGTPDLNRLLGIGLGIAGVVLVRGVFGVVSVASIQILAQRLERDVREELFAALLNKSQTFHDRQHVGDLTARVINDVRQLNSMLNPGADLVLDALLSLVIPLIFIGLIRLELLLAPALFIVAFVLALLRYSARLGPVAGKLRHQFGVLNSRLTETIVSIELVKASAQEQDEQRAFMDSARAYRDLSIQEGRIKARYLPPLLLALAMVGALVHGVYLVTNAGLTVGELVSYIGLMLLLRYPAFISLFSFGLLQLGLASAARILALMREEIALDEKASGYQQPMRGEIAFQDVSFSYNGTPVLKHVSFSAAPGQTIAIVGQVGAGKTTLAKLVNRLYDVDAGRVLVDGVDVREWNLGMLRSQIATIEQEVFLFACSIADNIAFGLPRPAQRSEIERAARLAQAHDFAVAFADGYDTLVGNGGVTLSGGQRQRIAIARALLANPRILVLDDSTSAVDSATEDEIQRAIREVLRDRTTLLITHRLSQIRKADRILVLRQGEIIDQGVHAELIERCAMYQRLFEPDDAENGILAPPLFADSARTAADGRSIAANHDMPADSVSAHGQPRR